MKTIISIAIVCLLPLSVYLGSLIIAKAIKYKKDEIAEKGVYQLIKVDEQNIVILDTRTGQYWKKPIKENSAIKEKGKDALLDNYV